MNRSERRARARHESIPSARGVHEHVALTMPLEMAIMCNNQHPLSGLDDVLHGIREEAGLNALVSLCAECGTVVLL